MGRNVAEGISSYTTWAPPGWVAPPDAADEDRLRERFARPGFVAHVDADVSAHVAAFPAEDEPSAVHLLHLFVQPHWQGTGVAAALLQRAIADARKQGAQVMRLRTPTGNARGLAFYAREGFALAGPEPELLMGLEMAWLRRPL